MAYQVRIGERTFEVELDRPQKRKGEVQREILLDGERVQLHSVQLGPGHLSLLLDGRSYDVSLEKDGDDVIVMLSGGTCRARVIDKRKARRAGAIAQDDGAVTIKAPMPGLVISISIEEGAKVKSGEGVVVVEAMKMQNELRAPRDGTVEKILVKPGSPVNAGDDLVVLK
jgi:biotin carboxyl carrier protein